MKIRSVKRRLLALLSAAAVSLTALPGAALSSSAVESTSQGGEAMVLYTGTQTVKGSALSSALKDDIDVTTSYTFDTSDDTTAKTAFKNASLQDGFTVSLVRSENLSTEQLIAKLKRQRGVVYAEPNPKLHLLAYENDPLADYQWALDNTGQYAGTTGLDINADDENLTADPAAGEQVIALVDTGVDYTHPDLADKIWENPLADTGILAGEHGYDFVNLDDDPMDDNGHGSHCAGIMAASTDNGIGIAGVAASENVKVMGLKILDAEGYSYGMEAVGAYNYIYQAQRNGVNVIAVNNSWGGEFGDDTEILETLINLVGAQGAISVCAAGNESVDNDETPSEPCNIDSPYVVSVAASDENDALASFSNWGAETVDLAAPGIDILSTVSYDNLYASLLTDDQKSALYKYEDFSTSKVLTETDSLLDVGDENTLTYYVESSGEGTFTVEQDTTDWFGPGGDGSASLRMSVTGGVAGDIYSVYLPYVGQSGTYTPYFSYVMVSSGPDQETDGSEGSSTSDSSTFYICNSTIDADGVYDSANEEVLSGFYLYGVYDDWEGASSEMAEQVDGQTYALALQFYLETDGDYMVTLDDVMMTDVETDPETLLQKYDYYSGTSMATPVVSGAVAILAAARPELTAVERAALLLGCTRPSESLAGLIKTGGTLDLSYLANPNPILSDISLDSSTGTVQVTGIGLDNATITVNDSAPTVVDSDDMGMTLDVSSLAQQLVTVSVTIGDNTTTESFYYATGTPADAVTTADSAFVEEEGTLLSYADENALYYLTTTGAVYTTTVDALDGWYAMSDAFLVDDFLVGAGTGTEGYLDVTVTSTKFVSDGALFYTVVHMDMGYMQRNVLAAYDPSMGAWEVLSEIPATFSGYTDAAIGYLDGTIYILGGSYDGTPTDQTLVYDTTEETWTTGAALPMATTGGEVQVADGQMYFVLYETADGTTGAPLVFDGTAWALASEANPRFALTAQTPSAAASAVLDNTLYYIGLPAIGVGDIIAYDTTRAAFVRNAYSVYGGSSDGNFAATIYEGTLYILYNNTDGLTETAEIILAEPTPPDDNDTPTPPDDNDTPTPPDDEETTDLGDLNGDGNIDIVDAQAVLAYYAAAAVGDLSEDPAATGADIDGDGDVDVQDASYVLEYYALASIGETPSWDEILGNV